MTLILYYVAFMIGGDLVAYFLGLLVEYEWGTHVSLIVFLVGIAPTTVELGKEALPTLSR